MVREIDYVNIGELLSRVLRHPLLQDFTKEQAIQYVIDFIGLFGFPRLYEHKEEDVPICDYKGTLPCDLVEIEMVKECKTNMPLRSMTSAFNPGGKYYHHLEHEPQFKTQGRTIIVSFPEGVVHIAYLAIPVDDEGLPLLIDNPKYLKALELYVRCQMFTILFDLGKIQPAVLQHTEQEYTWAAGQLSEEFKIPSEAEMESITNMLNQMIVKNNEFANRFETLGNKEHRIIHNNGSSYQHEIWHAEDFHHGPVPPHVSALPSASPAPSSPSCTPSSAPVPPPPAECAPEALTDDDIDRIINQPVI